MTSNQTQPLTEALTHIEVLLDEIEKHLPLPVLTVPLTKQHHAQLKTAHTRAREFAAAITAYLKENQ